MNGPTRKRPNKLLKTMYPLLKPKDSIERRGTARHR